MNDTTAKAPEPTRRSAGPSMLIVLGAVSLSLSATFVKLADVTSGTAAFLRCALALVVLVPMAYWELSRRGAMPRQLYWWAIVAGIFLGADYVMWTRSILDVGASIATVLINVQVIALPLIAVIVDRTPIPRRFLIATPLIGSSTDTATGLTLRGSALGLAAGVAYAGYLFLNRRSSRRSPAHTITPICVATSSAAVTAGLISLIFGDLDLTITPQSWAWMAALALLGQVAAWMFISLGSRDLPTNTIAGLLLLQPVLAIAFGFFVLGERPTWLQLLGAGIVVAAVATATRATRDRTTSAPDGTRSASESL